MLQEPREETLTGDEPSLRDAEKRSLFTVMPAGRLRSSL